MPSSRRISVEDLANLRWAMEPDAHPTDKVVAYTVSGPDRERDRLRYNVFLGGPRQPKRLFARDARAPRWSPEGDRVAYSAWSGNRWTPSCRTARAGEEIELPAPPGDLVELRWAPNGARLLAITTEASSAALRETPYRVSSSLDWSPAAVQTIWLIETGGDPIAIAEGGGVVAADWSPDGNRIAYVSDLDVDRDVSLASGLWIWNGLTGETRSVLPPDLPLHTVAWSPDGSRLAYLASARDNAASALLQLWVMDVDALSPRQLATGLDRSIGRVVRGDDERGIGTPILRWAEDSGSLLAMYAEGGSSRLARFALDGHWEDLTNGDPCALEFSVGRAGMALTWSDSHHPGELSWVDASHQEQIEITDLVGDTLGEAQFAGTTRISVEASDGVEVEGWLTRPFGDPPSPLVLQVHGGPHYPVGGRFSFDAQRLAARGIAVLRANPRGSLGYGQAFADGNLGDWGGRDLADLIELVDTALESGGLDARRVGIIGESYGGYMALWAVASTDRFAAAVVENGIADFISSAGGPVGPTFWYSEMGGAPWENATHYVERSGITRLDAVSSPVLVIHCEADSTCPISHGESIYSALRDLGRPVEFLRVPGENHFFNVFGALSRRLERTTTLDDFLVSQLSSRTTEDLSNREEESN